MDKKRGYRESAIEGFSLRPFTALRGKKCTARKWILPILAVGFAASLACDLSILSPRPTATLTPTFTETASPSITPSSTAVPSPTRTSSPTPIPGIEEPVQVGEANLLITKALRRDVFRCGDDRIPADNPESEEFLVIVMKVVKGPSLTSAQLGAWIRDNKIDRITLGSKTRDGQGQSANSKQICPSRDKDTYILTQILLGFVIDKRAEIFTLGLPDGKIIPLDSLIPS